MISRTGREEEEGKKSQAQTAFPNFDGSLRATLAESGSTVCSPGESNKMPYDSFGKAFLELLFPVEC